MENILVILTKDVSPYLTKRGLIRGQEDTLAALVEEKHLFLPRAEVEENPKYKQIIPYIVLIRGTEVFCTTRLDKGGEKRLHGSLSLGIGGHINSSDDDSIGVFGRGLRRELEEEVKVSGPGTPVPRGIINDDTNEVGRVHLGFFFTMRVANAEVLETDKLQGSWIKIEDLPSLADRLEIWSQIVAEVL